MGVLSVIGALFGWALTVFIVVLLVRMVLDWVGLAGSGRVPWVRRARALAHVGTEPVIGPVRRVLPPLRAGGLAIDLAFTVVFIAALILRTIAFNL